MVVGGENLDFIVCAQVPVMIEPEESVFNNLPPSFYTFEINNRIAWCFSPTSTRSALFHQMVKGSIILTRSRFSSFASA